MSDVVKPRIRLDKKEVKKGEAIEVKTLVSHTMESGQRKDSAGKTIPRKIINKFTAEMNGKLVFSADIEPAFSANPYLQFKFKPDASGELKFTWVDDDGVKITAIEAVKVG
jgi:sulfur-oxidizing protein SoxZ